jgi:hypothetical protein
MSNGVPEWTYASPRPGLYEPPAVPVHYNNGNWSVHPLYDRFNLKHDFDIDHYLGAAYFDHNYPLAVWLSDNRIVKAESPQEFTDLVRFTWQVRGKLPAELPPFPNDHVQIVSFEAFKQQMS